jgi:hypothetical protein
MPYNNQYSSNPVHQTTTIHSVPYRTIPYNISTTIPERILQYAVLLHCIQHDTQWAIPPAFVNTLATMIPKEWHTKTQTPHTIHDTWSCIALRTIASFQYLSRTIGPSSIFSWPNIDSYAIGVRFTTFHCWCCFSLLKQTRMTNTVITA